MEPWDGPASIAFTDGTVIGAVLDRNGLRPSRYYVTRDDLVIMASEVGVLDVAPENVLIKAGSTPDASSWWTPPRAGSSPTRRSRLSWPPRSRTARGCARTWFASKDLPAQPVAEADHESVLTRQIAFGTRTKTCALLLGPMAKNGEEPIGSMGTDAALAVLSDRPRPLLRLLQQLFAQSPIRRSIRSRRAGDLDGVDGRAQRNLLEPEPAPCPPDQSTDPCSQRGHRQAPARALPGSGHHVAMLYPTAEAPRARARDRRSSRRASEAIAAATT